LPSSPTWSSRAPRLFLKRHDPSGGSDFIADKIALWKALNPVGILYWDYNTNQGSDPFSARPGVGAAGAGSDGWLTVVDSFMSTTWPKP
jgi:hypothetical protein